MDPDVDITDAGVRSNILENIQAQLREIAGSELQKAESHNHGSGPRKLPHRYPQALIEGTTKSAKKVFAAMVQEIHDVLTE